MRKRYSLSRKKWTKEGDLILDLTGIEDEKMMKLVNKERLQRFRKKVFSIPFFTMLGIWILVYFQVTSHYHNFFTHKTPPSWYTVKIVKK